MKVLKFLLVGLALVCSALWGSFHYSIELVQAAPGGLLNSIVVNPPPAPCYFNPGVAFDGSELLISCVASNVLTRVRPSDGANLGTITISGLPSSEGIGGMSWDATHDQLWIGTGYTQPGKVYAVSLNRNAGTGTASLKFTHPSADPLHGMAFDSTDNTLWIAPIVNFNVQSKIYHYSVSGSLLGTIDVTAAVRISNPAATISGIAVASASKLYITNDGSTQVLSVNKDGTTPSILATGPSGKRIEDIECDTVTFWPRAAVWGKYSFDNNGLNAWEVPPGSCTTGGVGDSRLDVGKLKKGDILLESAAGLETSVYAGVIGTYWFHSALYDGQGNVVEAAGMSADDAEEVRIKKITETEFYLSAQDWVVLRVKPQYEPLIDATVTWAKEKAKGTNATFLPYSDWLNSTNKTQDTEFYCSLFVWRAFKEQGLDLDFNTPIASLGLTGIVLNALSGQVLPDDLYASAMNTSGPTTVVLDKHEGVVGWLRTLVALYSPADLRITDSNGMVTGVDPIAGTVTNTIPGAFYSGPTSEPEWFALASSSSRLTIDVQGVGQGSYVLAAQVMDGTTFTGGGLQATTNVGQRETYGLELAGPGQPPELTPADSTPPISSIQASPQPNSNGWNATSVLVNLTSIDNNNGSGVKEIRYSFSGAQTGNQTVSGNSATLSISSEGTTTLSYFGVDNSGNQESVKNLTVKVDKTKPTIAFLDKSPANPAGWNSTNVVARWNCSDALSGPVAAVASETAATEGSNQSVVGTCNDKAGNSASHTVTGLNIDKTRPVVTGKAEPAANANGWNNTDVVVSFTGTDGLSGINQCDAPLTVRNEGTAAPTGKCTDKAGNTGESQALSIKMDKGSPTFTKTVGDPKHTAGSSTFVRSTTPITVIVADSTSGVSACTIEITGPGGAKTQPCTGGSNKFSLAGADGAYNIKLTATDLAGNSSSDSMAVMLDGTGPVANVTNPGSGAQYAHQQVVAAAYTCSDAGAGVASCVGSLANSAKLDTSTIGARSFTWTSKDNLGNERTETWSYTVVAPCSLTKAPPGYTLVNGTAGNDLFTLPANALFLGQGGNDIINAPSGDHIICTLNGNDVITTGDGNDLISAAGGNNIIKAGSGSNSIWIEAGNDQITTAAGDDWIEAGEGNNVINAGDGKNYVKTGAGNDIINTGSGDDEITAGVGNNVINAGAGKNKVTAQAGNDQITTGSGDDNIQAGDGNNVVNSGAGLDSITTGSGNDYIECGDDAAADVVNAGGGNNRLVKCP